MDCALGWSGVRTDDLFNGFYDVVSCNRLQDKKALFYDLERDIKKLIRRNILDYNSHWGPREMSGKLRKVNFGESCRMIYCVII